jgi:hypothetical protein
MLKYVNVQICSIQVTVRLSVAREEKETFEAVGKNINLKRSSYRRDTYASQSLIASRSTWSIAASSSIESDSVFQVCGCQPDLAVPA